MSCGSGADTDLATQHPDGRNGDVLKSLKDAPSAEFREQPSPPLCSPEANREVTIDRGGPVEQTHQGRDEPGPVHWARLVTSQNTSAADTVGETLQGPENATTCFNQESDFYRR